MKKQYILIKNNAYSCYLLLDNRDFDYYTNVQIQLDDRTQSLMLYNDNLLYLKNIIKQCHKFGIEELSVVLDENNVGILSNEYYRSIYENEKSNSVLLDDNGYWIGEKYRIFSHNQYETWLYKYQGDIILKVTPVYMGFEQEGYFNSYIRFQKTYKDIFRERISLTQLKSAGETILGIYREARFN